MEQNKSRVPTALMIIGALIVGLQGAPVASADTIESAEAGSAGAIAEFEGKSLDLSQGWGEAKACLIWSEVDVAECFRSEAAMDRRIAELEATPQETLSGITQAASSTCAGYLRLYDGTSYGPPVLYLRDRYQWLNLSVYGFNQRTSSYKVGPCFAYFADLANGGGSWYPTSFTEAYDAYPSMISGWNNDVSSVYIG